jgi:hypothetical protein
MEPSHGNLLTRGSDKALDGNTHAAVVIHRNEPSRCRHTRDQRVRE